jgi:hypothetical protein
MAMLESYMPRSLSLNTTSRVDSAPAVYAVVAVDLRKLSNPQGASVGHSDAVFSHYRRLVDGSDTHASPRVLVSPCGVDTT